MVGNLENSGKFDLPMRVPPKIHVLEIEFSVLPTKTRFPFRYGITAMTEAPHLFVRSKIEVDGKPVAGIASEGLPPKWFTKNPDTTFEEDDHPNMMRVIRHASDLVEKIGNPLSFFEFWKTITNQQKEWATQEEIPPLLAQLGTAMMERTVLDGLCRALEKPLHEVVQENVLGIKLDEIHSELEGFDIREVFNTPPLTTLCARHTVGLADPLTDSEIPEEDKIDDGLPHSLVSNIRKYGLTHFKLKLCGNLDADQDRLRQLTALFEKEAPADYQVTIDGNEQYKDLEHFREHWDSYQADPAIAPLFDHLLFVEQPIHRDHALDDSMKSGFENWENAPPVIIDESDASTECLPKALELGYAGTSHKNCKGIIKSLANCALIKKRGGIMSAEDLANLGPIALLQDLAVVALLGIDHVERNGHHFFAGLSMFPSEIQERVLDCHPDLYEKTKQGFPSLRIEHGKVLVGSVNAAPLGIALDPGEFHI